MTPLELITIDLIEIAPSVVATKDAARPVLPASPDPAEELKLSSTLLRSFITKE